MAEGAQRPSRPDGPWQTTLRRLGCVAGNVGICTPWSDTRSAGAPGGALITTLLPGAGVREMSAAWAEPASKAVIVQRKVVCCMALRGRVGQMRQGAAGSLGAASLCEPCVLWFQ